MRVFSWLLIALVAIAGSSAAAQTRAETRPDTAADAAADAATDTSVHAVAYVETMTSARATAVSALERYRSDIRMQAGFVRADVFEQAGRPGHWVIIESWRDQKALDARDAAIAQRLLDALRPIRVSGFDQRPYKALSVASAAGRGPGTAAASASQSRQAVSVIAHVDVTPGPQPPVMLRQLAEASRREDGNLRFDVLQHTMRANHFTVIETWRNQQALDAHVAAAHTKQYRDEVQPLTGSPLDERAYAALP